jgi:hypothetical protein
VIDDPAFAAGVVISAAEPPPRMVFGVLPKPGPQAGIRIGWGLCPGLVALGCSVLPGHAAGESLTHTHHRDEVVHGRPPSCRAQNSPLAISFNAAFSNSASASSRLSVEFSFSSSFNRLASSAFNPPNWLRHR